jgi:hypothetical protein
MNTYRSLSTIAREIRNDWKKIYFGAVPYLEAMSSLDTMKDQFYCDDASSIVAYFLSNATGWRGDTAKRVKAELNAMLKGKPVKATVQVQVPVGEWV